MFTSLITWILRSYVSFQYQKSTIKKLYHYSRIKSTKRGAFGVDENESTAVHTIRVDADESQKLGTTLQVPEQN